METTQKDKLFGYLFKVVLSLLSFFCLYNVVSIIFLSPYSVRKLQSRISSTVNAVKSNIKHAAPKKIENVIYRSDLVNKANDSTWAKHIQRTSIFAGPVKARTNKANEKFVRYEKTEILVNMEIIFKGLVDDLAYINIRMKIGGLWREYGFPTNIGERIGGKKVLGGKTYDFTTNYILQDIVYKEQRPTTLMKKAVILNDAGEFVGTRMIPGETFMKTTSKIKYKDEHGNLYELWLKESEKTVKVEESTLSKNGADEAKKPFEENVKILGSIMQEAESGR